MWKLKGFNAAYNAYEVYQDHKDEFGCYFASRDIDVPIRFFYAIGKDFVALSEAAKKCHKWLEKQNHVN